MDLHECVGQIAHGLLSDEALATWVVALVTAGAVLVAVIVPLRQMRKERLERRRSILAVAEAAHTHARRIFEAVDATDRRTGLPSLALHDAYDRSIIDSVTHALRKVPLHELGTRDGVLALMRLTDQMIFLGRAVEDLKASPTVERESSLPTFGSGNQFPNEVPGQVRAVLASVRVENVRGHWKAIDESYQLLKCSVEV
jgi:hypothetical protein